MRTRNSARHPLTMDAYRAVVLAATALALAAHPCHAGATDGAAEKDEIRQLREQIERLREEYETRIDGLERAIERLESTERGARSGPAMPVRTSGAATPRGNQMNPRISVIGDFIVDWVEDREQELDWELTEAEIGFQAEVDPYLRFDVYAALEQHGEERPIIPFEALETDDHAEEHEEGLEVDLEEAYVTTLGLPAGLQLRAGKFLQRMGRNNPVHTPEDPWADQPTISEAYFGDHGHSGTGFDLSWLLPTPFYWELAGSVTDGPGESPTFASADHDDFHYLLHNKLFFDLSPLSTLQVGQSWARGPAEHEGRRKAEILGLDATFKWTPNSYRGLTWQTEVFSRRLPVAQADDAGGQENAILDPEEEGDAFQLAKDWGAYTWFQYRFSKRWFAGIRIDYVDYDSDFFEEGVDERWDFSPVVEYWPSEFQTLRFQYKRTQDDLADTSDHSLYLNWVWVMGAHGSHPY